MISIFISFLYFVFIFYEYLGSSKDKNENENYVIFAASLIFSVAINGLISMLLIATKTVYLPIFFINSIIFLILIDKKKYKAILLNFFGRFSEDFVNIKHNFGKKFTMLIALILILLFFAALGPINHVDTVKDYVGYPFQYYLRNSHFIDGDLGQGLLGIGDFANITFIQEKSIWLIRVSQYLPLVPILMFLGKKKIPIFVILIFITSPVFLQWLTIGKITFLGDSCLSLIYVCWKYKPIKKYAFITFVVGLISIAIKISSVLIFIPIFLDILFFYKLRLKGIFLEKGSRYAKSKNFILLISISSIVGIFSYRFFLTGNFFFPILSSIFSKGNAQLQDWEMMLRNWDREGFYQLWLFVPKNPSKIASVLGPATGFLFVIKFWNEIRTLLSKKRFNLNIGFVQLIFLLIFSQGRADYYFSPLFLIICGGNNIFENKFKKGESLVFFSYINILKTFFIVQALLFTFSNLYMIVLNFYAVVNYDEVMNRTAYGYFNSKIIKKNAVEPVIGLATSPPRLFYDAEFVPNHNFWKCFKYSANSQDPDKENYCLDKLKVKTVIVEENHLMNNKNYECNTVLFKETPRNIFKSIEYKVDLCKKK